MSGRSTSWYVRRRDRAVSEALDKAMHLAAFVASRFPRFRLEDRGIRVERGLRYASPAPCLLDVYAPAGEQRAPVVLYLHGGGFKIGSRRSHAAVAEPLVSAGFVVVLVDYRLAPAFPYPHALDDCAEAYLWILENIARFGGDPGSVFVGGESAGANLALGLTLATTHSFERPSLRRVFDAEVLPRCVFPLCGFLQVSDPERFARVETKKPSAIVLDRIRAVSRAYLEGADASSGIALADPLVLLEEGIVLDRPMPPVFISCGGRDPILEDSLRLGRALSERGVVHELRIDLDAPHAYQPIVIRQDARAQWKQAVEFFREQLDSSQKPGLKT